LGGEKGLSGAVSSLQKAINEEVAAPPCHSWRVISGKLWNSGISFGVPALGARGVRKPAKLFLLDVPRHIMSTGQGGLTGIAHNPNITSRLYVFRSSYRSIPFTLTPPYARAHTHPPWGKGKPTTSPTRQKPQLH